MPVSPVKRSLTLVPGGKLFFSIFQKIATFRKRIKKNFSNSLIFAP
jgi:hypothetical protein